MWQIFHTFTIDKSCDSNLPDLITHACKKPVDIYHQRLDNVHINVDINVASRWPILVCSPPPGVMIKKNLEETAYQAIMNLILEHDVKPGDVLLETELTEQLNMRSRTPVRHALTQLVAKGFLEKKPKRGYYIPFPSRDDAHHVFFAREHIEGLNAASAAKFHTETDIKTIHALLENEAETGEAGQKNLYSGINESFHLLIAKMGRNPYLEQYSQHLFWRSSFYIFYFGSYYTEKDFVSYMLSPPQHRRIYEAIESGDADAAQELMRHHVRFTCEKILSKIAF